MFEKRYSQGATRFYSLIMLISIGCFSSTGATTYTSESFQKKPELRELELLTPANAYSAYTAVMLSYLIPTIKDDQGQKEFQKRLEKLLGYRETSLSWQEFKRHFSDVEYLGGPFHKFVLCFMERLKIGNDLRGSILEVNQISKKLNITIRVLAPFDELKPYGTPYKQIEPLAGKHKKEDFICIVQDKPLEEEILDPSIQESIPYHYRGLATEDLAQQVKTLRETPRMLQFEPEEYKPESPNNLTLDDVINLVSDGLFQYDGVGKQIESRGKYLTVLQQALRHKKIDTNRYSKNCFIDNVDELLAYYVRTKQTELIKEALKFREECEESTIWEEGGNG